jgi:hypothetical protein
MNKEQRDAMIVAVAKLVGGAIEGLADTVNPVAFIVNADEMRKLLELRRQAHIAIKDKKKPLSPIKVDEVIGSLWDECKMISRTDMNQICEGLTLVEQAHADNEAALTPEWVNCY